MISPSLYLLTLGIIFASFFSLFVFGVSVEHCTTRSLARTTKLKAHQGPDF